MKVLNDENKKEVLKLLEEKINDSFELDIKIDCYPHPYCITDKHITDKYMYLSEDVIRNLEKEDRNIRCGMYVNNEGSYVNGKKAGYTRCTLLYDDHIQTNFLLIILNDSVNKSKINNFMNSIKEILINNNIEKLAFARKNDDFEIINDN